MLHFELPQALEIILEVQLKRSNEKIAKKKTFQFTKHVFFHFFGIWTPPTAKASNFIISCSF
jgi:hypothetical protein